MMTMNQDELIAFVVFYAYLNRYDIDDKMAKYDWVPGDPPELYFLLPAHRLGAVEFGRN